MDNQEEAKEESTSGDDREESKGMTASKVSRSKRGTVSDTFSIQIDHNYINGVSPVLDIVKETDKDSKELEECKDSGEELAFDDVADSEDQTTIIG